MAMSHRRTLNGLPAKGTKKRKMLAMLLRCQGATGPELAAALGAKLSNVQPMIEELMNFKGWDIRTVGQINAPGKGRPASIKKIVGRYRENGRYRSFIRGDQLPD